MMYPNDIIIRQRGFKWRAGLNTNVGRDHTIHSKIEGQVKFTKEYIEGVKYTTVHVLPALITKNKLKNVHPYMYHPELYPELAKYNPEPEYSHETLKQLEMIKNGVVVEEKAEKKVSYNKIDYTDHLINLPHHLRKPATALETIEEEKDDYEKYEEIVMERYEAINEYLNKQVDRA